MDQRPIDLETRQALSTFQQYLSDTIAPLMAADAVAVLLNRPEDFTAQEIIRWISAQYQGKSADATFTDYIFHAIKKIYVMGGLKLVAESRLEPFLEKLKQRILDYCPEEDRGPLGQELDRMKMSEAALAPAVAVLHRPLESESRPSGSRREREEGSSELKNVRTLARRLSILWKHLAHDTDAPSSASVAGSERREGLVSQVVATAAASVHSDHEFRQMQEKLKTLGVDSSTDQIFRVLSRSLPGWSVPVSPGEGGQKPPGNENAVIDAMRQILLLSEDGFEGCKRFQEMVQAAIEQFNAGSLARAATMLDLASGLAAEGKLDAAAIASMRRTAHESLDLNRLRSYAKKPEKQHLLRKVLNFFTELRVQGLLDSLPHEQKRDQRRLILSLLETHGEPAREAAFQRLRNLLAGADLAHDWYFPRNLTCLLTRIPRSEGTNPEEEIAVMEPLVKLSLPAPLVREAITNLGQIRHVRSEQLLITILGDLEKLLLEPQAPIQDSGQLKSLLDRAVLALAQLGTPRAYRKVIEHGLRRDEELGDCMARLSYLNGQDMSADEQSVTRLVKTLKASIPRKLLGVVLQKNEQNAIHLVKALSSTPAPAVQQVFENIAARFPEKEIGKAAAKALEDFNAATKRTEVVTERLLGDLEIFALPDLLQQISILQLTGTLTLKDAKGDHAGSISLVNGRLRSCSAGPLDGDDAIYQLLEKPIEGTFVFQGRRERAMPEQRDESLRDVTAILFEGMRRYDELQRARAIVPDSAVLKPTGSQPQPHADDDIVIFETVWKCVSSGSAPEKCEADCQTDSYRVRTLLSRWVEEDVLSVG